MDADVIVVGAGLSGLVAANSLKDAGHSVIVLDKGRSVGGRLATRRIQNGLADHGAQFFTVRTAEFQRQVDQWLDRGLVSIWGYGWSDGSLKGTIDDGHPRFIATGGMNQLAKDLASDLDDVRVNVRVQSIQRQENLWQVIDDKGIHLTSRALIMTPPVPQSLALLMKVSLADADREQLERIQYGPCLCGLFVIDGRVTLPPPGAVQNQEQIVYWIADNRAKGISPQSCVITMHLEARYSHQHFDDPDQAILDYMRAELQQYLADGASISEEQLKRWRYSIPLTTYPHDIILAKGLPLVFAGDAFGGRGRVEGAYLSGIAAGKVKIDLIAP